MKFIYSLAIFIFSFLFLAQFIPISNVYATTSNCSSGGSGTSDTATISYSCLPHVSASQGSNTVPTILNIVFTIIGAVSVLIIVLAGFKFITSSGKPEEVAKAKDTIIYAAVGLIVCIFAVTIVSFVAGYI